MQIEIPNELKIREQAVAAGFASVEAYVTTLLDRDAERVAIRAGLDALTAGRTRRFEVFDREFRQRNNLDAR